MEFIDKSDIMKGIGPDITADILEKGMGGHKYFKREGTPGNYQYYYTEAEYNKTKGKSKSVSKKEDSFEEIKEDEDLKEGAKLKATKPMEIYIEFTRFRGQSDEEELLSKFKKEDVEGKSWKGFTYKIKPGEEFSFDQSNNWDRSYFRLSNGIRFLIEAGNPVRWLRKEGTRLRR